MKNKQQPIVVRKPGQQAPGMDQFDLEALAADKALRKAGANRRVGRALVRNAQQQAVEKKAA